MYSFIEPYFYIKFSYKIKLIFDYANKEDMITGLKRQGIKMKKIIAILLLSVFSLLACPNGQACDMKEKTACEKNCPKDAKVCPDKTEEGKSCPKKENCHSEKGMSCNCATKCVCEGKKSCDCKDDCTCPKCKAKK